MKCHTDYAYNQDNVCMRDTTHLVQAKGKDKIVLKLVKDRLYVCATNKINYIEKRLACNGVDSLWFCRTQSWTASGGSTGLCNRGQRMGRADC